MNDHAINEDENVKLNVNVNESAKEKNPKPRRAGKRKPHAPRKPSKAAAKEANESNESNEQTESKGSDRMLVWSIVFVIAAAVLIFSAGYYFYSRESYETVEYNNFIFTKMSGMWYFEWQDNDRLYTIPLRFSPYEAENVTIDGKLSESFNRNEVYVTFDPDSGNMSYLALGAAELSVNMARAVGVTPIAACTKSADSEGNAFDFCEGRPILSCTPGKSVIYIRAVGSARILLGGECIVLEGSGFELVRAIDRLLYQWYGIIK